ncbi:MAG: penicillin-binding protein 2 [Acidaminococcaceae bacterium]|nr:penicillin-binding protein 2 [Acidaminococcaceae bacterium]
MLNHTSANRLKKMLTVALAVFLVLGGRLAWLQLYKGLYYGKQADGNRMRSAVIMAPRGRIMDIHGKVLADSSPGYVLSLQAGHAFSDREVDLLARLLGMNREEVHKKAERAVNTYEQVVVKGELTQQEITLLEEHLKELPGLSLDLQPMRHYLYKESAAHVLGYVGEVSEEQLKQGRYKGLPPGSIVGKEGLELIYDDVLRGETGRRTEEVDVRGKVIRKLAGQAPVSGKDLVLTIDFALQQLLEQAMDKQLQALRSSGIAPNAYAAAAVAMDPNTGAVRALVSRPGYDPNWFVGGISTAHWKLINENVFHPLTNKVINGEYPAGSTFKVVTGSAALDQHKVTPEELIFDSGRHWLADMGNAGGEALGWINFQTAFAMSDNVYFYEMGRRAGIENLNAYAAQYGFGKPTGIELAGESAGLIAGPAAKKKVFDEEWTLGDTFNAAIGQGLTLVTPMQICQMLAAVAADGVVHPPYLVEKVVNPDGTVYKVPERPAARKLRIEPETIRLIQKGLKGVTQPGGTGAWFSGLPLPVAGKTGTAENPHGQDHGWFIAYAPAERPDLAIACVVEQGSYGATAAGPIVYEVLETYLTSKMDKETGRK